MPLTVRITVLGAVVAALVTSMACTSGGSGGLGSAVKAYCAKSEYGCRCKNEAFTLEKDEVAVDACDGAGLQCCHDLDTAGESTTCECSTYVCIETPMSDECNCDFVPGRMALNDEDVVQPNCEKTEKNSLCCERTDSDGSGGHPCSCNGAYTDCPGRSGYSEHTEVTKCSAPSTVKRYCSDKGPVTSCSGLRWKAPTPPGGGGGGGGGGGSSPECTSDSSCSSKCSGDCYACRSGSCKCGRRGVSGACLY